MSRLLYTKKGSEIIVDDDVYDELLEYKIYNGGSNNEYAKLFINKKLVYLHRYITKAPIHLTVDHINGNKLDNRRDNLRLCTIGENARNKKGIKNKLTNSIYKGLFYVREYGYWKMKVTVSRKTVVDIDFTNELAAVNAYNHYAKLYHGEYANLNECKYMSEREWSKYIVTKVKGEKISRFQNVVWDKEQGKWRCIVNWGNDREEVGRFLNELEAAIMVNECYIKNNLILPINKKIKRRKLNILTNEEVNGLTDKLKDMYQKQLDYYEMIDQFN